MGLGSLETYPEAKIHMQMIYVGSAWDKLIKEKWKQSSRLRKWEKANKVVIAGKIIRKIDAA